MADQMKVVAIEEIAVNSAWNARSGDWTKVVDPVTGQGWEAFCESIKNDGVQTPLEVRPTGKKDKPYELIAGFRRYKAATSVGVAKVPVTIKELAEVDARIRNLSENLARENLKPADTAFGIREVLKAAGGGMTDTMVAARIGCSQGYVSQLNKIMTEVKPSITKAWREARTDVTLKEMNRLVQCPKERQEEEFAKILAGKATEDKSRGTGAWVKMCKAKCFKLGTTMGQLVRLELMGLSIKNDEKGWLEVLEEVICPPGKATIKQKASLAKEIQSGFENGLTEPEEEEEEEEEEASN